MFTFSAARKALQKTKAVLISRGHGSKLSGPTIYDTDMEVIEWLEYIRHLTGNLTRAEGVQFIQDHLKGTAWR